MPSPRASWQGPQPGRLLSILRPCSSSGSHCPKDARTRGHKQQHQEGIVSLKGCKKGARAVSLGWQGPVPGFWEVTEFVHSLEGSWDGGGGGG